MMNMGPYLLMIMFIAFSDIITGHEDIHGSCKCRRIKSGHRRKGPRLFTVECSEIQEWSPVQHQQGYYNTSQTTRPHNSTTSVPTTREDSTTDTEPAPWKLDCTYSGKYPKCATLRMIEEDEFYQELLEEITPVHCEDQRGKRRSSCPTGTVFYAKTICPGVRYTCQ